MPSRAEGTLLQDRVRSPLRRERADRMRTASVGGCEEVAGPRRPRPLAVRAAMRQCDRRVREDTMRAAWPQLLVRRRDRCRGARHQGAQQGCHRLRQAPQLSGSQLSDALPLRIRSISTINHFIFNVNLELSILKISSPPPLPTKEQVLSFCAEIHLCYFCYHLRFENVNS